MSKHTDIKMVAYTFQVLGLLAFVTSLLYVLSTQIILFALYGLISFVWLYAIGGALLVLVDIAKSVRASALVAIEREDSRKASMKPSSNGKTLGLQRLEQKKVKHA